MRRYLLFTLVGFALVIAAAVLFAPAGAPAKTVATKVVDYTPAHMEVTTTLRGSCWVPSIAIERRDAYRCMSANEIFDPCFVRGAGTVYCPQDLIADRGTVIRLTKALPPPSKSNKDEPWAMQLKSGDFCTIGTGTIVPGFPFYCTKGVCSMPAPAEKSLGWYAQCGRPRSPPLGVTHPVAQFVRKLWR